MPMLIKYNTPEISSGIEKYKSAEITKEAATLIQKNIRENFFNGEIIRDVYTILKDSKKRSSLKQP
tara:strand:- start:56 stop:253 length:198 start_codon:yes stop_codon:yes gene_type:complete